jgi:hypothetical protein
MDEPVRDDCVKPGIREQYLEPVVGGGIALEARAPIGGYLLKNGFTLHEVLPNSRQKQ